MHRDFLITLYIFSIFLVFLSIFRIYSNLQLIITKLYFNQLVFDKLSSFIVLDIFFEYLFPRVTIVVVVVAAAVAAAAVAKKLPYKY